MAAWRVRARAQRARVENSGTGSWAWYGACVAADGFQDQRHALRARQRSKNARGSRKLLLLLQNRQQHALLAVRACINARMAARGASCARGAFSA